MAYSLHDYLERFEPICNEWMSKPGVVNAGIGRRKGRDVFILQVESQDDADRYAGTETIEELPVLIEVGSAEFVASTKEHPAVPPRSRWIQRVAAWIGR